MLLSDLVHLPVTLACHSSVIVARLTDVAEDRLHAYWIASRSRTLRWGHRLRAVSDKIQAAKRQERIAIWLAATPLVREILLCEMTTHIWSSILAGVDRRRGTDEFSAVTHGVARGHQEVRFRALDLLSLAREGDFPQVERLQDDRRSFEAWCDHLLQHLPRDCPIRCHGSESVSKSPPEQSRWASSAALISTQILAASPSLVHEPAPLGGLNRRVQNAVFGCLGSSLFGHGSLPMRPIHIQLLATARDERTDIDRWLPAQVTKPAFGKFGTLGRF